MHPVLPCVDCGRARPTAGRGRCGTCYFKWARAEGRTANWRSGAGWHGPPPPLDSLSEPWRSPRLRDIPTVPFTGDAEVRSTVVLPRIADLERLWALVPLLVPQVVGDPCAPEDRLSREWRIADDAGTFLRPVGRPRLPDFYDPADVPED